MSSDYHDYFIKDGRHVGDYEKMYQNCDDPWRIEELGTRLDMKAALLLLEGEGPFRRVLDVGAGLGFFSQMAAEKVWTENPSCRVLITDISPTAVRKAEQTWSDPRLSFATFDLCRPNGFGESGFDLIMTAQLLWSLLKNLPTALKTLRELLADDGRLLISQHFFQRGKQSYGADIVSSPEDLSRFLDEAGFEILHTLECDRNVNHHWAALLKKK